MKDRILLTRRFPPAVELRASSEFDAVLNPDDKPLGAELVERAGGCSALLVSSGDRIDAGVIASLPASVKVIATFSVGYDHIDLAAAAQRGLVVANTPDVLTEATAEIALLLMLGACRRGGEGHEMVRNGKWPELGGASTFMLGQDLGGKRLGIVGMGRIGRAVAARAKAFNLEIHYHNRQRLPAELEVGAHYHPDLGTLLGVSQILSLHCPSSAATRQLMNGERLDMLPHGAVVVNTARGDIVDDEALLARLRTGQIFAAGLDVFAGEPRINPGYQSLPNVFLLPHLGSATVETRDAMGYRALDNINAVLGGRPAPDALKPPVETLSK